MSRLSASAMGRVARCAASCVLPAVNETGKAALIGTDLHAFVTGAIAGGRTAALERVPPELRVRAEAIDLQPLLDVVPEPRQCEVAIIYDTATDTARTLGAHVGRNYGEIAPGEIPGATDVLWHAAGQGIVLDIKTGAPVEPAASNQQLRTLALGASRAFALDAVDVVIAYVSESGEWTFDRASFDGLELDGFASDLRALVKRVDAARAALQAGRSPDVSPSEEACRYCNCLRSCPAYTALALRIAADAPELLQRATAITAEHIPALWEWRQLAHRVLTAVDDGLLRVVADLGTVQLPSGKTLQVVETPRERVSGKVALEVLTDLGCEDLAAECIEQTTTKEKLRATLASAAKAKGANPKQLIAQTLDVIRERGGMTTSVARSLRETK